MLTPIEVLQEVIIKHESAIRHSRIALNQGKIDTELHKKHRRRNHTIINRFKKAIKILQENGKTKFI